MDRLSRKIGIALVVLALASVYSLCAFTDSVTAAGQSESPALLFTVRSSQSSSMVSTLLIESPSLIRQLLRAKEEPSEDGVLIPDLEVSLRHGKRESSYRLERSGKLWNPLTSAKLVLSKQTSRRLLKYADALRNKHYGQLIPWEQARNIVTRKSAFTITDLESGLSFRVQRRAGSSHADVQPLTKVDSAIMKRIYDGKWSWDRKAIVVQKDSLRIAASMNGMPHGGDGIPDNGFSGHFCVHFLDSTSHRSVIPDPDHQLMVYKAAGNLRAYFESSPPLALAERFIEALNRKDEILIRQIWDDPPNNKFKAFIQALGPYQSISVPQKWKKKFARTLQEESKTRLTTDIGLPIRILANGRTSRNDELHLVFKRNSFNAAWKIEDVFIIPAKEDHSSLMP
ncbi:hypothetical protein [Cohnella terricola]|uniref:Uncharacterized protein n=1 Tax=Cohnella terricola TaxID=1289167 RepID=A0A559JQ05_9BACL|nr:hypothetical protein [Cohnella terricola]TVY01938.1 hypothetical protein FPZ45_05690 [Cohnella terricola]